MVLTDGEDDDVGRHVGAGDWLTTGGENPPPAGTRPVRELAEPCVAVAVAEKTASQWKMRRSRKVVPAKLVLRLRLRPRAAHPLLARPLPRGVGDRGRWLAHSDNLLEAAIDRVAADLESIGGGHGNRHSRRRNIRGASIWKRGRGKTFGGMREPLEHDDSYDGVGRCTGTMNRHGSSILMHTARASRHAGKKLRCNERPVGEAPDRGGSRRRNGDGAEDAAIDTEHRHSLVRPIERENRVHAITQHGSEPAKLPRAITLAAEGAEIATRRIEEPDLVRSGVREHERTVVHPEGATHPEELMSGIILTLANLDRRGGINRPDRQVDRRIDGDDPNPGTVRYHRRAPLPRRLAGCAG